MKLVYDEDAIVTIQLTGTGFPEGVRAELTGPFSNIVTTRNSSSSVTVTAEYSASGASPGDTFDLTLKRGRFRYVYQNAIEIVALAAQPLDIGSIKPGSIDANNVGVSAIVTGEGFDETATISISGSGVTFARTSSTDTTIEGTLTAGVGTTAGMRDITVIKGAGSKTLTAGLEVIPIVTPIGIASISPSDLPQDSTGNYTIIGNDFIDPVGVAISGADVTVNSVTFTDSTRIVANITVGAGAALTQRNVTVTNPNTTSATLTNGVEIIPPVTAIIIDASWLTANGPPPYRLDQAGETYRLATNVTTPKTAFGVHASNITLDLDDYTITYASDDTLQPANNDFATDLSDWDITNCPTATWIAGSVIGPTTRFEDEGCLQVSVPPATTYYIETNQSYTLEVGQYYKLAMWIGSTTDLSFNVSVGSLSYSISRGKLGNHAGREFIPTGSNATGPLRISITNNSATTTRTTTIDAIRFGYTKSFGIAFPQGEAALTPGVSLPSGGTFTINGNLGSKIVQGSATVGCGGIYFRTVRNLKVDGPVEFEMHEDGIMDKACLMGQYAHYTIINGARFNIRSRGITKREANEGFAVYCSDVAYDFTFTNNTLITAPQGGLNVSNPSGTTTPVVCTVTGNTGFIHSKFTNGFCIDIKWNSSAVSTVANNTFDFTSDPTAAGRGLGFRNANSSPDLLNSSGNVFVVRELPFNQEYGGYVLAGVYGNQNEGVIQGPDIDGDSFTVTGSGGGFALRMNGDERGYAVSVQNTSAIVDMDALNTSRPAACIGLLSIDGTKVTFDNLTLRTNEHLAYMTGGTHSNEVLIADSSIELVPDFSTKPFMRDGATTNATVRFRNSSFVNPASKTWVQTGWRASGTGSGSYLSTVSFDENCTVTFTDGVTPLVGVAITITNSQESIVFTGTTNGSGQITGNFEWYRTTCNISSASQTSVNSNPFTISSDRNASEFPWTLDETTRTPTFNLDA
jgi:hypothetical protein